MEGGTNHHINRPGRPAGAGDRSQHQRIPGDQGGAAPRGPGGRIVNVSSAEDCAGAVLFLVSPRSEFITGETIEVNGGQWFA